jgi:serralysin
MTTLTSNFAKTLNGTTNFTVGGDTYRWSDRFLETLTFWAPDDAPQRSVTLAFAGNSWGSGLLRVAGNISSTFVDKTTGTTDDTRVFIDVITYANSGINRLTLVNAEAAVIKGYGGTEHVKIGSFAEAVLLGRGNDSLTLTGTGEVDQVNLGRGNDRLFIGDGFVGTVDMARGEDIVTLGAGGAEYINLGRDADIIRFNPATHDGVVNGGEGISDDLSGAADSDTVDFSAFTTGVTVDLLGRYSVSVPNGTLLISNFENAIGGAGKDTLVASDDVNRLTGGAGADTFAFATSAEAHGDRILDFSQTQKDRINLSDIDATTTVSGNDAFTFIGTSAFHKKAGELRYEIKSGDTIIQGDVNGDGVRDFSIILDASVNLKVGDFIL